MDVSADEKQKIREKIEKLKQSKFKQQTLPAWRPVPTAMSTMFTFSIFSVIFLAIGVVLYVMSDQIIEFEKRYDKECGEPIEGNGLTDGAANSTCDINFHVTTSTIPGSGVSSIYVYYQLDNFYQNHRRYVKSRDNEQLAGKYKDIADLGDCDPITSVSHLWSNQMFNKNGVNMTDDASTLPAIPCGLVAKSVFNDTFVLREKIGAAKNNATDKIITINKDNIAWSSDITYKFKNIDENLPTGKTWEDVQWLDMTRRK